MDYDALTQDVVSRSCFCEREKSTDASSLIAISPHGGDADAMRFNAAAYGQKPLTILDLRKMLRLRSWWSELAGLHLLLYRHSCDCYVELATCMTYLKIVSRFITMFKNHFRFAKVPKVMLFQVCICWCVLYMLWSTENSVCFWFELSPRTPVTSSRKATAKTFYIVSVGGHTPTILWAIRRTDDNGVRGWGTRPAHELSKPSNRQENEPIFRQENEPISISTDLLLPRADLRESIVQAISIQKI